MQDFKPFPWQQVVVNEINENEDKIGSESMQSLPIYERNKRSRIHVSFPRGSGHTALASYLSYCYPSTVIFFDLNHYRELEFYYKDITGQTFPPDSNDKTSKIKFISVYEIYHDMTTSNRGSVSLSGLDKDKSKFSCTSSGDKRVVIIDHVTTLLEIHPEIVDWVFQVADGPIVMLG